MVGLHDFYLMPKCCLFQESFFLPLSLSLLGRLCSGSVQVSLLSRFILVEYSRILTNPYIKYITCLVSLFGEFYLFVGWVSFFCVKLQEVVIIFNIARRGRSFIIIGSLLALLEFRSNSYFNKLTSY